MIKTDTDVHAHAHGRNSEGTGLSLDGLFSETPQDQTKVDIS